MVAETTSIAVGGSPFIQTSSKHSRVNRTLWECPLFKKSGSHIFYHRNHFITFFMGRRVTYLTRGTFYLPTLSRVFFLARHVTFWQWTLAAPHDCNFNNCWHASLWAILILFHVTSSVLIYVCHSYCL
jgi:hypothetical protein